MMVIQMKPGETHLEVPPPAGESDLVPWLDVGAFSLSVRHRYVRSFAGTTIANNGQYQFGLKASLRLDPEGRFTIHTGTFSGNSFSGGWNNTGIGLGDGQPSQFLKQLYFSAKPVRGVEFQYGGIEFARGESSEITSYDFDGYLVGQRISLRRPDRLFFDEITATVGYLGDLTRPNVLRRLRSLGRSNYRQLLAAKNAGRRVRASFDYTADSSVGTLRQAVTLRLPESRLADMLHFEQYERPGARSGYGFAAYAEKKALRRLAVGGGYAQIDRAGLFSDRFNAGKRFFSNAHVALSPEWSVAVLGTYALAAPMAGAPRLRFDVILSYNFLHRLRASGVL
jgi:hypothetical protein